MTGLLCFHMAQWHDFVTGPVALVFHRRRPNLIVPVADPGQDKELLNGISTQADG